MKAAIVTSTGSVPICSEIDDPVARDGEALITVSAAPISPVVRLRASAPIPADPGFLSIGFDGVGTDNSGRRVYFLFPKAPFGALAERTLVPDVMTVPVPEGLDDASAAAIATAGVGPWAALTRRVSMAAGQTVLVTGANGSAGRLALQIARHLGASRVIAVTRSVAALDGLAADQCIALDEMDADRALQGAFRAGVDIILDFAWGSVAERIIAAATTGRGSPLGEPRLRYTVIGASTGEPVSLAGYPLQSSGIEIVGSGFGSVPASDYLRAAGELLDASRRAGFTVPHEVRPLREIGEVWTLSAARRYIICP